jgi:hypothetical protein
MIQRFLWKLIGADRQVLARCPVQDRYRFALAGSIVLLVLIVIFFAFFGITRMVFDNRTGALCLGVFASLAIGNLYMLNIITIESSSLPQRATTVSKAPAMALRVFLVSLLALIVSKLLELYLFADVKDGGLLAGLRGMSPAVWLFTLLVITVFLAPLYMKLTGLRLTAYGNTRREIELALVRESYFQFRMDYERIMSAAVGKPMVYKERYTDPPFNTNRIIDTRMILGKGKLIEFLKKKVNDLPGRDDPTRP